jgi:flagellar basal body-associated protein FliL
MAEVLEKSQPDVAAVQDPAGAPKRKSKKILIGTIVTIVVAVQAVVTWFVLRGHSGQEAGESHAEKGHAEAAADEHDVDGGTDVAEVRLGDFSFSNGTASPGSIMHVDFKLSAVTAAKQASSLEAQVKAREARIRQAVNRIVRSSGLDELNDPGLTTIKRLARDEINRVLQKSYVIEVVITDFRLMEQ